jgi:CheY-like chemotaxis protein
MDQSRTTPGQVRGGVDPAESGSQIREGLILEDDDSDFSQYERAVRVIAVALALGLVALGVFSVQASSVVGFAAVVGAGLALVGAGFALGAVIGFLFGIPRRLQEPAATPVTEGNEGSSAPGVPYAGNTSLEQISDWLTKIIVGVGLTQLLNLPTALSTLGAVVGPALGGFPGSSTFGTLAFIYFGIGGFFAAYLWTRLRLTRLLVESDEEAKRVARKKDREFAAIKAARTALDALASETQLTPPSDATGTRASPSAARPPDIRLLWVDDRPANNVREIEQLKAQGIQVTTMTDSEEALAELRAHRGEYAAVITDLKRGPDRQAGYNFMAAARAGPGDSQIPFIIYTASSNPNIDTEAKARGAIGGTNSPIRLFELVNKALHQPVRPRDDSGVPRG